MEDEQSLYIVTVDVFDRTLLSFGSGSIVSQLKERIVRYVTNVLTQRADSFIGRLMPCYYLSSAQASPSSSESERGQQQEQRQQRYGRRRRRRTEDDGDDDAIELCEVRFGSKADVTPPTLSPTNAPTEQPTTQPTKAPTTSPTVPPTVSVTVSPTTPPPESVATAAVAPIQFNLVPGVRNPSVAIVSHLKIILNSDPSF